MTVAEAQAAYRSAWRQRCLSKTREQQIQAESAMDAVQQWCTLAQRPGSEWDAFIDTLPGYRAHWAGLAAECDEMIAGIVRSTGEGER